jgi:hypothetical protein
MLTAIMLIVVIPNVVMACRYADCHYAERCYSILIWLVVMLTVIMPNVVMVGCFADCNYDECCYAECWYGVSLC